MTVSNRTDTGGRLAREWARLRTRPRHLATATAWGIVDTRLDDLDQVLAAVGYMQPPSDACEQRLRRLVTIAADDDLAARIVVQRLVPGLLAMVRRRRGAGEHVFDELLGAAWIAVRTFNPERRPRSIAAALISDADYSAFRAGQRRRSSSEIPSRQPVIDRPTADEPSSCEQLAAVMQEAAAAGVPADDLELLRQLLATPTAVELAAVLDITPRTIRNRRARITSRLREVALAA